MGISDNGELDTVEWASPFSHCEPPDPVLHSTMRLFHPPPLLLYHVEGRIKAGERAEGGNVGGGGGGGEGGMFRWTIYIIYCPLWNHDDITLNEKGEVCSFLISGFHRSYRRFWQNSIENYMILKAMPLSIDSIFLNLFFKNPCSNDNIETELNLQNY